MRLSFEISFEQLLTYIKQLSFSEKEVLVSEIQKELSDQQQKPKTSLQELLISGPTWSETEYQDFLNTREQLKQFGRNDSP